MKKQTAHYLVAEGFELLLVVGFDIRGRQEEEVGICDSTSVRNKKTSVYIPTCR